jgi:hypothetical protein
MLHRNRARVAIASIVLTFFVFSSVQWATTVDAATPAPIFRVFLKDGTALACWGEYARVGDRFVLTVPIGTGARATYEFVSIPASKVDVAKTERYAEAVRAAQFAASRGAAEYADLSDQLSTQLASIAGLPDPKERLKTAESARQQLIDWAATSHGYKADDVQQLLSMFDSAIIDLRMAAGESRFAINLSAGMIPPAPPRLRAAPGLRQSIDLALKAAAVADSGATRLALLRRARTAARKLDPNDPSVQQLTTSIALRLARELAIEESYRRLMRDIRRASERAIDAGDVAAIDKLRDRLKKTDRSLGERRADDINALLIDLDAAWTAAAEHRLVLDEWEAERLDLVAYQQNINGLLKDLDALAPTLAAIKALSGPTVTRLVTAQQQTAGMVATFSGILPPETAAAVHPILAKAIEAADLACRTRHRAIVTKSVSVAWEAAAAAAEARTATARARDALTRALTPPKASR